jgi:signal transduction histidine kinase
MNQHAERVQFNNALQFAVLFDEQRDAICQQVTFYLERCFPTLCLDSQRPDSTRFQRMAYEQTPRRFHRMLQIVLRTGAIRIVTHEFQWVWQVVPRYGVNNRHILAMVGWYFNAARDQLELSSQERDNLYRLKRTLLAIVSETIGGPTYAPYHTAARLVEHSL